MQATINIKKRSYIFINGSCTYDIKSDFMLVQMNCTCQNLVYEDIRHTRKITILLYKQGERERERIDYGYKL